MEDFNFNGGLIKVEYTGNNELQELKKQNQALKKRIIELEKELETSKKRKRKIIENDDDDEDDELPADAITDAYYSSIESLVKAYAKMVMPWRAMMVEVRTLASKKKGGNQYVICKGKSCNFHLRFKHDKKGYKMSEYQMQHTCTIEDADNFTLDGVNVNVNDVHKSQY